jgi:hypothetical protein
MKSSQSREQVNQSLATNTTGRRSCTSACVSDARHRRTPMMDQVATIDDRGPFDQGGHEEERKEKKNGIVDELWNSSYLILKADLQDRITQIESYATAVA